jgi:hypothetical protein
LTSLKFMTFATLVFNGEEKCRHLPLAQKCRFHHGQIGCNSPLFLNLSVSLAQCKPLGFVVDCNIQNIKPWSLIFLGHIFKKQLELRQGVGDVRRVRSTLNGNFRCHILMIYFCIYIIHITYHFLVHFGTTLQTINCGVFILGWVQYDLVIWSTVGFRRNVQHVWIEARVGSDEDSSPSLLSDAPRQNPDDPLHVTLEIAPGRRLAVANRRVALLSTRQFVVCRIGALALLIR